MESKYVDIPLNNNDNDDEENTSTTIQRRIHQQNSTADKQNNNDLHVMVRKIFCNHFVPFVGLFALCAFIGIGTPMIWNQIWKPNSNVTIETDLRYDCSPLKPKKSEKCSEICKLDQLAKYDEIRCYYRMETSEDIDDDSILMPRYSIEQIDDFNYLLSLKTPPPFIHDQKNDDLSKDPIIHRKLSLSIRYHNPYHSSVLIKPIHEGKYYKDE